MNEAEVKAEIRKHFGLRKDMRIFNNPVGNAYMSPNAYATKGGMILPNAQRITFGLCVGSSDLIGWQVVNGVARFLALEVKTKTGRPRPEQLAFIELVNKSGGAAGIVRSIEDVEAILRS